MELSKAAMKTWAKTAKDGLLSRGTALMGGIRTGMGMAGSTIAAGGAAGIATVAGLAVAAGGVAYVGYGQYVNYANQGREKKYQEGTANWTAKHNEYIASRGKNKKQKRSSEQLTALNPGNATVEPDLVEQTAGTSVDKAAALPTAENLASNSNAANATFDGNPSGSPTGAVSGTVDPTKAARANALATDEPKKLSPEKVAEPPKVATVEKKESWWKKFVPENPKKKAQAGTFPALLGGALAVMAGVGTGGILLGVGAGFLIGAYLWGREND